MIFEYMAVIKTKRRVHILWGDCVSVLESEISSMAATSKVLEFRIFRAI